MPPLFSIVCVWNNEEQLNRILLPSLHAQSASTEILLADNRNRLYSSCAAALNATAAQASGEYFVFVHQDAALPDPDYLAKVAEIMPTLPRCGVAGPAGIVRRFLKRDGNQMRGGILSGPLPGVHLPFSAVVQPEPVFSLDELLLIVPRTVFRQTPFDPVTCPGWHLYGVDLCLSLRRKGLLSYVLPLPAYHLSGGKIDDDYLDTLGRLIAKHRRQSAIATTCGNWSTLLPARFQHRVKKWLGARHKNSADR